MSNKKSKLRVTILGSNSGRNAGDAAILAAIMRSLSEETDGKVSFEVPTTHPQFVDGEYGDEFEVRGINVMPWTGSVRLLGIPTFKSIRRTDVTLITDGIIFDINLWNPLFNFLITLIFLVPWAKMCGKKVVCYNVGIGPLDSFFGKVFARWVGNACDIITVRDQDSLELFRKIGVNKEIHLTADSVFQGWASEASRVDTVISELGLEEEFSKSNVLGVNITRYIDRWLRSDQKVSDKSEFVPMFARVLAKLKAEQGIEPLITITQIMDLESGERLAKLTGEEFEKVSKGKTWAPKVISNKNNNNHDLIGLDSRCSLFVGMRLHSLIIACRAACPVVGLVYAPKVRSFLSQLGTPDRSIELAEITEEGLYESLLDAWNNREQIKQTQQAVHKELEERAAFSARLVVDEFSESKKVANG